VQEAADLRASDVFSDPTPRVHLHEKGDKWRVCPLWAEAALLKRLLSEQRGDVPDRSVFIGAKDTALTRFGIYKIIRRYTTRLSKKDRMAGQGQSRLTSGATALQCISWRLASK